MALYLLGLDFKRIVERKGEKMSSKISDFLVGHDFLGKGAVGYLLAGAITLAVVHILGYLVRPEWLR